jgi:hypothetical protein
MYSVPVHIVSDFNIRLDRQEDPITQQFCSLLSGFGLYIADTGPTTRVVARSILSYPPFLLALTSLMSTS